MNKVTVVIPNYNGMNFIENCLQSMQMQTYEHMCIVVVDNGSVDGSKELIRTKFPSVHMYEFKKNEGFCKAVNAGIAMADTPYILLLNNDTVASPDFVEQLVYVMESHTNIFSVSAKMLMMHEDNKIDDAGNLYCALGWAFALGKGKPGMLYHKETDIFSACAGAALYRKAVFQQIGMFDEAHFAYLEDVDIGYRAKIFGYRNVFAPKAKVLHAGSGFSGSRYNEFKIRLSSRNSVYIIYKNMPLLQIILNIPFLILGFLCKLVFFAGKGFFHTYANGLIEGVKLCLTKEAKKKKIVFSPIHTCAYVKIQIALWVNMIRKITG